MKSRARYAWFNEFERYTIFKCELALRLSISNWLYCVRDLLSVVYGLTFNCVSIIAWIKSDRFFESLEETLSMRWKRNEMKWKKKNEKSNIGLLLIWFIWRNNFYIDFQLKHINIARFGGLGDSVNYTSVTCRPVVFLLCSFCVK